MKRIRIALMVSPQNENRFAPLLHRPEFVISGRFCHPHQFEKMPDSHDIIVVDTDIVGISAARAIEMMLAKTADSKIIAICTIPDIEQARTLIQVGVTGILLKHELTNRFAYTIRTVHAGHIVISPLIMKKFLD